jgi:hypothetical protein
MATISGSVTSKKQLSERNEALKQISSEALKVFAFLKFSTEDSELHPPTCKQHIWQQILFQAVTQAAKLSQNYPTLKLMHGLLPCSSMEALTFHMDAAYRSTQFSKEELTFLRKLRLEQFLCNVPWGVVHPARASEAINTLQEDTLKVTLKGEVLPLFSGNWRELFLKVFHLTPRGQGEGGKLQLQDLFPSLAKIQEGQKSVKVGDCQVAGSKRPLRLLSSFFCLNTSGQYSISIHFANLVLAALNGEKVDWPLELFDEFKAEVITLHRHQKEDKVKVIKTAIGPHLTLIMDEAKLFDPQERKTAGFGTPASLTLTEKAPPRKRKLDEQPGKGKLEAVIRVTQRYPHPSKSQAQAARDAEAAGEPSKRRVIQNAEKWEVPDSTSTMINQICFTHRRLEQLLTTFTSKAGPEFIQRMDDEFQKLQTEATSHYKQGLKEKESLTENEHAVEKGLLRVEIRKLTEQIAALNENYDEQIEVSFDLQDQLTTAEGALATLTETNRTQQATCDQLTADLDRQNNRLAAIEAELEATNEQFTELQLQHQGQSELLATTEAQLRLQQLASKSTSPDTPRSGDQTPHASGSTVHIPTSGLYSMVEGALNPPEVQERTIQELQQELAYIRRERDDLQVTLERVMESPHRIDDETLDPADISRASILPKTTIYQQLTANTPPFTTIMQCYHALKGLNLLTSRVPLLKPGTTLSRTQFERIWSMADATARDTLAFMWVTGEIKMHTGIMELVTGSPPFYVGRFVLRTLSFISHHHSTYYNHTPVTRLPTLKSYPNTVFRQIREFVKNQPLTFTQTLKNLTTEDTTICQEAIQHFTWLQERHSHRLPGPYTIQQVKDYVLRVIKEKETTISTRRFGTPSPRTILHPDHYSQARA